jgi:hypothetical protein
MESLSMPFLAQIWRRRAELLGGVPALDITATRIVLSQLKEDGRSHAFGSGATSSSFG